MVPYDDELELKEKLDGLRFRLDKRTGAILADEIETPGLKTPQDWARGSYDATPSLLSDKTVQTWSEPESAWSLMMTSSDIARTTAAEQAYLGPTQ